MAPIKKTNAMRILDRLIVEYNVLTYELDDGMIDGVSVAEKIGRKNSEVFKTLVTQGNSKEFYVFIIPVDAELDLKKAAAACHEKKVEMIPAKDILKHTGYIRGGCSPIGMKKSFKTFIDSSAQSLPMMVVSAGKIGLQIELALSDLLRSTEAALKALIS